MIGPMATANHQPNLYESEALRSVTGPAIRPGGLALTSKAVQRCGFPAGARVLDIGCGVGASVEYLRGTHGLKAVGLDMSRVLLEAARCCNGPFPRVQARAQQLPVADQCLNGVFCECVLSLCAEPMTVLAEARRVLAPGGYLVITDVYARSSPEALTRHPWMVNCCLSGAVSQAQIQRRVEAAGFSLFLWEDHTALLKRLAAQLVFTFGSMAAFWSTMGHCRDATADLCAVNTGRPGYYLLVAR